MNRFLKILLTSLCLWFGVKTQAQELSLIMPDTIGMPGTVLPLDITVQDFEGIVSMQFSLNWNPAIIEYTDYDNMDLDLVAIGDSEAENGMVRISWFDTGTEGGTVLENGSIVLRMYFTIIGEEGDFTAIEFTDNPLPIQIFKFGEDRNDRLELNGTNGSVSVGEPEETIVFNVDSQIQHPSCFGDSTGAIVLNIDTNIEDSLVYNWTGPDDYYSSQQNLDNIIAGVYTIEIQTVNDTTPLQEYSIRVEEPTAPLEITDLTITPIQCEGQTGQIDFEVSGGIAPYDYQLNGEIAANFSELSVGNYTLLVSDANNCETTETIEIIEDKLMIEAVNIEATDCQGNEGSIEIIAKGGTGDYTYYADTTKYDSNIITDLSVGDYRVYVRDNSNCAVETVVNIPMDTAQLQLDSLRIINETCDGQTGQASVYITGGTTPYSYYIGDNAQQQNTFENLSAGDYQYTVRDAKGCLLENSFSIENAPDFEIDLGDNVEACRGETVTLRLQDDYTTYQWSTEETTATIGVTQDGWYNVSVQTSENCTAEDSVFVHFNEAAIVYVESDLYEICLGDSIRLLVGGGDTYEWIDTSETLSNTTTPYPIAKPTRPTTYQVIAQNECGTDTTFIEVLLFENAVGLTSDTCIAPKSTIDLEAWGGVDYQWSVDNEPLVDEDGFVTVSPIQETTYYVNIEDENGCTIKDSVTIEVADRPSESLKIINVITPNGDGQNDVLEFENIEKYGENVLSIYNRWGNLVYEKIGYQKNEDRFDGTYKGKPLPAGTYYYILSFRSEIIQQSLLITRE